MPAKTGTFTLISSNTLGSDTSFITFSSIPATYTDLVILCFVRLTRPDYDGDIYCRYNNDTATNYSATLMNSGGIPGSPGSRRVANDTATNDGRIPGNLATAGLYAPVIINILDYANTTTYKSSTSTSYENQTGGSDYGIGASTSTWRSTAAINRIDIAGTTGFKSGSTFRLYGIEAGNL